MIRPFETDDLDRVMNIWLAANTSAHDFIEAGYWQSHFEEVRQLLPQSDVYIFEEDGEIQGFIGLTGDHIAGLFVAPGKQSRGIGKALLDHVKKDRSTLFLKVYQKNIRAIYFYVREGFRIIREDMDESSWEAEYRLTWSR